MVKRKVYGTVSDNKKYREKLFNDDPTCGICGKEIPHINNSTLDHIIPKHYGGATARSNLRLAHKKCNSERGHSLVPFYSTDIAHLPKTEVNHE